MKCTRFFSKKVERIHQQENASPGSEVLSTSAEELTCCGIALPPLLPQLLALTAHQSNQA
jgi:hypothetical protein